MGIADTLAIDANSTRAEILRTVRPDDWKWALPFMRAGYAGRALVYVVVAGVSLYSIARGGQASGTKEVFESLPGEGWPILALIALGMFAYAVWRLIDAVADLEAYGTDGKGLVARTGMCVTGLIHAGIGVLALSAMGFVLLGGSGGGGSGDGSGSGAAGLVSRIFALPGGVWIVGAAGAITIAAGLYYIYKGLAEKYRKSLAANQFTRNWNWVLKFGVIAQGVAVSVIGGLILYAALTVSPEEAGGIGAAFDWLRQQSYGLALIVALCVGFLSFALFCAVNARYRIIPKAHDGDGRTLAAQEQA